MQNIKTIIFDMGGVLIDLDKEACIQAFDRNGMPQVRELLGNYRQSGIFLQLEEGTIEPENFREELRKLTGASLTNQQIDECYMKFLVRLPLYKLQMLTELRQRYRVVMLSNVNIIMMDRIKETFFKQEEGKTIDSYFDHLYLSYEMHTSKPEPNIFERVLQAEGLNPEQTLLIDDGPANCETAARLGMKTYLAQPEEDFRAIFK